MFINFIQKNQTGVGKWLKKVTFCLSFILATLMTIKFSYNKKKKTIKTIVNQKIIIEINIYC